MKDVGNLSELGLQVGDTYTSNSSFDTTYTVEGIIPDGLIIGWDGDDPVTNYRAYFRSEKHIYRIKKRATSEPKLWRDMTAEEKGALLLAAHEGNVIEWSYGLPWITAESTETSLVAWDNTCAYRVRIKPEPKVETVTQHWKTNKKGEFVPMNQYDVPHDPTHRITFTTSDGKPDCASVKMEEL